VSRRVRTRAMLARTSQRVCGGGSFPALAGASLGSRNWPSIPPPRYRPLTWRVAEDDAEHWNVRFARFLLLEPEAWQATGHGSTAVRLYRHPYIRAFQIDVFIERQFSRIFPAPPRSLASVLIPRPAARRVSASHGPERQRGNARRGSDPCALRVSAFKKSLCKERKKIFRTFRKRRRLALGAGHTRVASRKSVPRVIRANTNKEN
jgi:hypothetical protein